MDGKPKKEQKIIKKQKSLNLNEELNIPILPALQQAAMRERSFDQAGFTKKRVTKAAAKKRRKTARRSRQVNYRKRKGK